MSMLGSIDVKQVIDWLIAVVGFMAAGSALYAAKVWHDASMLEMPEFDPPVASMDDNPSLHILTTQVQLNAAQNAISWSSRLNAKAARWAAISAFLTGLAIALSVIQRFA